MLTVDLVVYLGMSLNQIRRDRPSHMVDIAYLYYLPFCMVFTSGDKLHARLAPLLSGLGQAFLWSPELKSSLKQYVDYCEVHEDEITKAGLIGFLERPPVDMENPVSALWDQFLPSWRQPRDAYPPQALSEDELMQRIRHVTESNDTLPEGQWTDDPDFLVMQSRIPVRRGRWRLVPEGVEERGAGNGSSSK